MAKRGNEINEPAMIGLDGDDLAKVAALRSTGVDPEGDHDVAHTLSFADRSSALLAAEIVRRPLRDVKVAERGVGGYVVHVGQVQQIAPEPVALLRAEFEAVAEGLGGRYEGWSVGPRVDRRSLDAVDERPAPPDAVARNPTRPIAPPDRATDPRGDAVISLHSVTKTYGAGEVAVHALKGIDLAIEKGQFVVVLGPSGSGKTTLMNLIGGIEPPSTGTITVAGREIGGLDDEALTAYRRAEVGFVFQFFNLVPSLTAFENVALVAELVGRGGPDASLAALRAVGLEDRASHFPSSMSGGEQQRVAIARALVKEPAILLCDEPTGSLDLETGRQVLSSIHATSRIARRTVVLVTHNSAIARLADRVLRMGSGRVIDDRTVAAPDSPDAITW